ncbi:MAG TPA: immunoglobulin-like domain-containing protein [Paludibacter sp.]|nr:immunoglobulin-like domain-containing protein [Paludibacter sp.]
MKKNYLLLIGLALAMTFQLRAANVVPQAGVFYHIVQTPSNMVLGANSTRPVVQTPTNALNQAFEFVPVDGKADTYYIKSYEGLYMNKASNDWDMIYEAAINGLSSEWVLVDDASATDVFRLLLNANNKYMATDGTSNNSNTYCDKSATHERGLFKLEQAVIPTELVAAYNSLTLGDLSSVTANVTLPETSNGIAIVWASSLPEVISATGVVTRPDKFSIIVKLRATMSQDIDGVTFTMTKEFPATVKAVADPVDQLAQWDFSSSSISESNGELVSTDAISGFAGKFMNEAGVRTIGGASDRINVLDLGNGTGYFDMGTELGKAIYSLSNYTMMAYFRVDENYSQLTSPGNFIWNFSNSDDAPKDQNGYIICSLKDQAQSVSSGYWAIGNQAIAKGGSVDKGGWHHIAYTQDGTTATLFIDGVSVATGTITNLPATSLVVDGRSGTLFNWLGRSCYPGDVYLRNTLIYDFQLWGIPMVGSDIETVAAVTETIGRLNAAYTANPKVELTELKAEYDNLTMPNLDAVTSDITLPSKGTLDQTIAISWKSANPNVISNSGVVTRPDYFNFTDTLYATLMKNGQKLVKKFAATVLAAPNTTFTGNTMVKFDFATVSDSLVTDAAEKHFVGKLKNGARINTIGTTETGVYNVLSLGDSIGYFDMGAEVGKVMYNMSDYTVGAYYRISDDYPSTELAKNGNFLWSFSNTTDILQDPKGYLIGSLKNQVVTISKTNWTTEQTVGMDPVSPAQTGGWHHMAYVQKGTIGSLYIDGMQMAVDSAITQLPLNTLNKPEFVGSLYNWIGRSCYSNDVYLRKTLVYDFRLYNKALTDEEIQNSELNVGTNIEKLDAAYLAASSVNSIVDSRFKVASTPEGIRIMGLSATDKVSVFDIAGRQMRVTNPSLIKMNAGIYIVKINQYAAKVVVE